ncbi:MAG: hypothetical protein KatS3mg110_2823 [Pirellulaceae bacterium]|nr:MAG: hypothetical protein KatS3mg110_2823 [Pirellulaceae bacterium]
MRNVLLLLLCGWLSAGVAQTLVGQSWAAKMFRETEHDFGVVARGAHIAHRFELQNIYKEDVHIAAVRSSCGCTTPQVTERTLKTWDKSEIVAVLNTHAFLGERSATITVVFDKPFYAEVQLHVRAYIRSDVVFQPGIVQFGDVDAGTRPQVTVDVAYAGRMDWQIVDVRSACRFLEVELEEYQRQAGQVRYRMHVRLKPEAPAGHFSEELQLVTNDTYRRIIPLAVEGYIRAALTASPTPLVLVASAADPHPTKKLLVRSRTPCRIRQVTADDQGFDFEFDDQTAKTTHFITVRWTGGDTQRVESVIHIQADSHPVALDVPATVEPATTPASQR